MSVRIVAGTWRGRALQAPPGETTRPTADRVRQALFDMLLHAPWAAPALVRGASVLDAFAGTGAVGLEALSRGAAHATFMDRDRAALACLRANVARCDAAGEATILAVDVLRPPQARAPVALAFLDPPYGADLASRAVPALARAGWLGPDTVIAVETGRSEAAGVFGALLAERAHGAAVLRVFRFGGDGSGAPAG